MAGFFMPKIADFWFRRAGDVKSIPIFDHINLYLSVVCSRSRTSGTNASLTSVFQLSQILLQKALTHITRPNLQMVEQLAKLLI
jgi:hypothetical protein